MQDENHSIAYNMKRGNYDTNLGVGDKIRYNRILKQLKKNDVKRGRETVYGDRR